MDEMIASFAATVRVFSAEMVARAAGLELDRVRRRLDRLAARGDLVRRPPRRKGLPAVYYRNGTGT
jgi:hypothetical protein